MHGLHQVAQKEMMVIFPLLAYSIISTVSPSMFFTSTDESVFLSVSVSEFPAKAKTEQIIKVKAKRYFIDYLCLTRM
jgi:hypothetical protein